MRTPEDYDTGFVCKACGQWYADKDVKRWIRNGLSLMPTESGPFGSLSMNAHCAVRFAPMFRTNAFYMEYGLKSREARTIRPVNRIVSANPT